MSELRYDALQKRWVIIATERQHRPHDFRPEPVQIHNHDECPFCPGHEHMTPPEIASIRPDGSKSNRPGWTVRVTQNKFPALHLFEVNWELGAEGFYETIPGYGVHEVIIEGPDHDKSFVDLSLEMIFDILRMYRYRLDVHMQDRLIKYALVFKNHGSRAGASLVHPHSQIIGTPVTPRNIRMELMSTLRHFAETNRCLVCDMVKRERNDNLRVIYDDGAIVAFCNYAARFPFEFIIISAKHEPFYHRESDRTLRALAKCLREMLTRLKIALNDPPFNFILHSGPNINAEPIFPGFWKTIEQDYHWHIEVIPRLVRTAGFEWGSGLHINPMPPETAAQFLREVVLTKRAVQTS